MSGQWQGSGRKARLPDNWPTLRAQVFKRSRGRCEVPDCPEWATDCDHITAGDDHSLSNLQALCGKHHALKSSREGNEARAWIRSQRLRPVEDHPGRSKR